MVIDNKLRCLFFLFLFLFFCFNVDVIIDWLIDCVETFNQNFFPWFENRLKIKKKLEDEIQKFFKKKIPIKRQNQLLSKMKNQGVNEFEWTILQFKFSIWYLLDSNQVSWAEKKIKKKKWRHVFRHFLKLFFILFFYSFFSFFFFFLFLFFSVFLCIHILKKMKRSPSKFF